MQTADLSGQNYGDRRITALGQLADQIVRAQRDGDPSIDLLLLEAPDLAKADWIYRCAREYWDQIVFSLTTNQLEWLIKAIVVIEREMKWIGGSVAATVRLFAIYERRRDGDWRRLADWILREKGRNDYLPFGFITSARSLEGWYAEQELKQQRHVTHLLRQQGEQEAKTQRVRAAQELNAARRARSWNRKDQLSVILSELLEIPVESRLAFIADQSSLPLEVIPNDLIEPCVHASHLLEGKVRQKLSKRIGRRKGGVWKALRMALEQEQNHGGRNAGDLSAATSIG